jgi:hypothetical protein
VLVVGGGRDAGGIRVVLVFCRLCAFGCAASRAFRNRTSQKPKTLAMMVRLYVNQRLVDKVKLEKCVRKSPRSTPPLARTGPRAMIPGGLGTGVGHATAVIRSSPRKRALADSSDDEE